MARKKPHLLGNCKDKHQFVLNDGRTLNNLFDLAMAMEAMNPETYSHHVNESKNDFANWIRDVYNEPTLAENLIKTQSKTESQIEILKALIKRVRR